jgi:hypothetical protein
MWLPIQIYAMFEQIWKCYTIITRIALAVIAPSMHQTIALLKIDLSVLPVYSQYRL